MVEKSGGFGYNEVVQVADCL